MTLLNNILSSFSEQPIKILDNTIPLSEYTALNLSHNNPDLQRLDMTDVSVCQSYIDSVLQKNNAKVAYGGYLEKRGLYATNSHFNQEEIRRDIHLGIDFWSKAGTKVHVPVAGKVRSFKNNNRKGDYGPTIILTHTLNNIVFYTLYGHLSLKSINNLYVGKEFEKGDILGFLGSSVVNVNYAPHLHFQIIIDMGTHKGDYPGVCSDKEKAYYLSNCPNPSLLLKI